MSLGKPFSRMLQIMDIVSLHPSGATMMEIAEQLNLPKSSCYRLVKNLVDEGYLRGEGRHSRYRLGARFLRQYHHSALTRQLVELAKPTLTQLANQFEETANLNSLIGYQIRAVCAEFPRTNHDRTLVMPGDFFPVHASASGKVICAYQEPALQQQMLEHTELVSYRPNSLTDPQQLQQEFARVREQGYAVIDDELDEQVFAVSVPVRLDGAGVCYSLGLIGPRQRIGDTHPLGEMVRALRDGAAELARLLTRSRLDTI